MSGKADEAQAGSGSGSSKSNTPAPSTTASNVSQSAAQVSSADDNLTCKWNSCGDTFANPELLYVRWAPPSLHGAYVTTDMAPAGAHL